MAPLVRTGGSRHTGLAAPPHRNIHSIIWRQVIRTQELENMERNTKDTQVVCAVNILLENKRKAKQMLGEMEENERDEFVRYPIYGLM